MSFPSDSSAVFVLSAPPKAPALPADTVLPAKEPISAAEQDPKAKRAIYIPVVGTPKLVKLRAGDEHGLSDIKYYLDGGHYSVVQNSWQKRGVLLVGDEDGLLRRLPTNRNVPSFVGPLVLTKVDSQGETADLPDNCTVDTWKTFF